MNIRRVATLALFLGLSSAGQLWASPIAFSDTFNPADVLFDGQSGAACTGDNTTDTVSGQVNGKCESLTWTHVLAGFNPLTDSLSSASLTLTVRNDSGTNNQSDKFDIVLDLLSISNTSVPDSTVATTISFTSANFATLLAQLGEGQLAATLTGANGNHSFYFEQSVLNAEGSRREDIVTTAAVPEPASLTLLGIGLTAVGSRLRRRVGKRGRIANTT